MSVFRDGPVGVATPASSANLGPGFDSLGLALTVHDELVGEVVPGGLEVEVVGAGSDAIPRDESHLVVVAMRATFAALGEQPPGLALKCRNVIPHGCGLGSSAAAIVGGVVLARALVDGGDALLDQHAALRIASSLEGHPDNVAASLFGGLTIAWCDEQGEQATHVDVTAYPVAFIPPCPVPTSVARELLPAQVPHADAARNAGRAALLVAALSGRPELLFAATEDHLHQRYRSSAMPDSYDLVQRLRADGVPAIISGAGPTVVGFADDASGQPGLAGRAPAGWQASNLEVDNRGARTVRC